MIRRLSNSAYMQDVKSRLPIIPTAIGGLTAVYVAVGLIHGAVVLATWAGIR